MSSGVLVVVRGGVFVAVGLVGSAKGESVEDENGNAVSMESLGKPSNVQEVSNTRQRRQVTNRVIASRGVGIYGVY